MGRLDCISIVSVNCTSRTKFFNQQETALGKKAASASYTGRIKHTARLDSKKCLWYGEFQAICT